MAKSSINKFCPRSGQPVEADALTVYKSYSVGFCNPGCRNDFAANPEASPKDRAYFDTLIKEYELPPQ